MSKLNIEIKEKFWAVNIVFKSWEGWGGGGGRLIQNIEKRPKKRNKMNMKKVGVYSQITKILILGEGDR